MLRPSDLRLCDLANLWQRLRSRSPPSRAAPIEGVAQGALAGASVVFTTLAQATAHRAYPANCDPMSNSGAFSLISYRRCGRYRESDLRRFFQYAPEGSESACGTHKTLRDHFL